MRKNDNSLSQINKTISRNPINGEGGLMDGYLMISAGPAMIKGIRLINLHSQLRLSASITGESGVGMASLARQLHNISDRRGSPFIRANCADFPETVFESEFFAHLNGCFTGATTGQKG